MWYFCLVFRGVIWGLVAAGIWVVTTLFFGYESPLFAILVGYIVGRHVQRAAGNDAGTMTGLTAVTIAIAAILLGKYLVFQFFKDQQPSSYFWEGTSFELSEDVAEMFLTSGLAEVKPPDFWDFFSIWDCNTSAV